MTVSRRRDNLTFAHHVEVAPVMPISPDKIEWVLDQAEDLDWSSRKLRAEVREYLRSLKRLKQLEELAAKQQVDDETGEIITTTYPVVLFAGTHQENMDDMARKGRRVIPRGEWNGKSKLTTSQVRAIRQSYRRQWGQKRALARKYSVSIYAI